MPDYSIRHGHCFSHLAMELIENKAMDPVTITCEMCGQSAFVLKARYKYLADGPDGRPAKEHVLIEVERQVECPECGILTQTEKERQR